MVMKFMECNKVIFVEYCDLMKLMYVIKFQLVNGTSLRFIDGTKSAYA